MKGPRSLPRAGLLLAVLAGAMAGCATYTYVRQPDSAWIQGVGNLSIAGDQSTGVRIIQIDGGKIGPGWSAAAPVYLSPGEHMIVVNVVRRESGTDTLDSIPDVVLDVVLESGHAYVFECSAYSSILLEDVSAGGTGVQVGEWEVEQDPMAPGAVEVDYVDTQHARPPLDYGYSPGERPRDGGPPHEGGARDGGPHDGGPHEGGTPAGPPHGGGSQGAPPRGGPPHEGAPHDGPPAKGQPPSHTGGGVPPAGGGGSRPASPSSHGGSPPSIPHAPRPSGGGSRGGGSSAGHASSGGGGGGGGHKK